MKLPTFWVVLPAYNEESALPLIFNDLKTLYGDGSDPAYKIVVVNDGSKDKTLEVARGYTALKNIEVLDHGTNRGLAAGLRTGVEHVLTRANADDVLVVLDADHTHPVGLIQRMIEQVMEGRDLVIASRFQNGAQVRGLSLFRRALSVVASWVFRLAFPMTDVRDYTCGFRAYRVSILQKTKNQFKDRFIEAEGFSCMVELLLKLRQVGAVCGEVPLVLRYDFKVGASKMRVFSTILESLWLVFKKKLSEPSKLS